MILSLFPFTGWKIDSTRAAINLPTYQQIFVRMNLTDLCIVFMGTPEFAVASLQALVEADCNIVGVITVPVKQEGRGMNLTESAVKKYAI